METVLEEAERLWRQLTEGAIIMDQPRRSIKIDDSTEPGVIGSKKITDRRFFIAEFSYLRNRY